MTADVKRIEAVRIETNEWFDLLNGYISDVMNSRNVPLNIFALFAAVSALKEKVVAAYEAVGGSREALVTATREVAQAEMFAQALAGAAGAQA